MAEAGAASLRKTKTCPRCGAKLFEDMGVCYGCLYVYSAGGGPPRDEPPDLDEPWDSGDATASGSPAAPLAPKARAGQSAPVGSAESDDEAGAAEAGPKTVMLCAGRASPTRRLRLRIVSSEVSVICDVPDDGVSIGRDPDNLVVVTSQAVSRHHLRLIPEASWLVAQDLGATNPPLLNGKQLSGGMRMHEGDVLELRAAGVTIRACA